MERYPSSALASIHALFAGSLFSVLSAIYLVSMWMPGVSVMTYPVLLVLLVVVARMHVERRKLNVSYTGYTLWLSTFAVLVSALFMYVLILAVGRDVCMERFAMVYQEYGLDNMPEVKNLACDPRIHVGSLALEYWLIGVLLLSPIANLLAVVTMRLRTRLQRS